MAAEVKAVFPWPFNKLHFAPTAVSILDSGRPPVRTGPASTSANLANSNHRMKTASALLLILMSSLAPILAFAQGAPGVLQMPQLTNMPGTNAAWNQTQLAPAIIFPGQPQQNPFMTQDPMLMQQMQLQQMQMMRMPQMPIYPAPNPYPIQGPWNQGSGGPLFSLGLNLPALGDMFSGLFGGDSGDNISSSLFGGGSRDRDFDDDGPSRRRRIREDSDCVRCERHQRRRLTRISADEPSPRQRWESWRDDRDTEGSTADTSVQSRAGSREIADDRAPAEPVRQSDTSKARADVRKYTGEPRPLSRGVSPRRDDQTLTAADKRRISQYRGHGRKPEVWDTFILNLRQCDASCEPIDYSSWREPGRAKSCHYTGAAVDVGGFRCGGRNYGPTSSRFENIVSCMDELGEKKNRTTGKFMKVLFRNGPGKTSGHNDHAHFSIKCYGGTFW